MSHKTAIVTGASRGIGRAIAIQLAKDGFSIVVNYASNKDAANQVVDQITGDGGEAIAVQADVGRNPDRQRLIQSAVENLGGLTVLVNNAGITSQGRKDLLEATEESWDRVFDTNLKGPFFLSQLAAKQMIVGKNSPSMIVNLSSISSYAISTNRADYCIAKAGMRMMTWLFAERLADHDIQVFEICPGVIASDMTEPVKEKYDALIAGGLSPIRRWGQPEDVASAVSALVEGKFPFSTGESFNIDGGFHIRRL